MGVLQDNELVIETESEKDLLLDFAIYEKIDGDKNAVELYMSSELPKEEIEVELLEAMKNSTASLYSIESIDEANNTLCLVDLLNGEEKVTITDIGFSQTASTNIILFTRIIKLNKFSITSGMSMIFSKNRKEFLISKSGKMYNKVIHKNLGIKRFVTFFKLNRSNGYKIDFEQVK